MLKTQNQVYATAEWMFWPNFVLIVLENRHLLSLCGLIFDHLKLIKRSQYYHWSQISNIIHHFIYERLKIMSVEQQK